MSCARLVIVSFHYPEAYPTPPPVCQADTAEEVEEQLEDLFQHPDRGTALGEQARDWVVKNHGARTLTDRLETYDRSIASAVG